MSLHFTAIGMPATKGSPSQGGRYERSMVWTARVAAAALEAGADPLEGPLAIVIVFRLPRPGNHFVSRGLRFTAPAWPGDGPSIAKLTSAVLNALTGICWHDVSQVVEIRATKCYAEGGDKPCGVTVTVMTAPWRTTA